MKTLLAQNIIYHIRDELLRAPGTNTEQLNSFQTSIRCYNERSKVPLPLYIQKKAACSSKREQLLTHAKRKPEHKQRRNKLLCCCDGHHDWTEGQIPWPPACKKRSRMNRRALGIKDKKLACARLLVLEGCAETTTLKASYAEWMIQVILITPRGKHDHQPNKFGES